MAAQGAVVLVDRLAEQNVSAVSTQAQVTAWQEHDSLGAVLTDHALLPLFLLLQKSQQVVSRRAFATVLRRKLPEWPVSAGTGKRQVYRVVHLVGVLRRDFRHI